MDDRSTRMDIGDLFPHGSEDDLGSHTCSELCLSDGLRLLRDESLLSCASIGCFVLAPPQTGFLNPLAACGGNQAQLVGIVQNTAISRAIGISCYTVPQNTVVPAALRKVYGNRLQFSPARFPPLLAGNFRIACPVAVLSNPNDEGTNSSHRYFRPIRHPYVSLCRGRRSRGLRGVPLGSWNGVSSE